MWPLQACSLSILDGLDDPPATPGDGDSDSPDSAVPGQDGDDRPGDGSPMGGDAGEGDAGPPPGTSFFSSFEADEAAPTWLDTAEVNAANEPRTFGMDEPMKTQVGVGPPSAWNAKSGAGFTGLRALRYEGSISATGTGYGYNRVFEVDVDVIESSRLSYVIFPDLPSNLADPQYLRHPSTYAAVDLAFDDGTYLSELGARDRQFAQVTPLAQGESRTLYSGEWNYKVTNLGAIAAGKKIKRILVGYQHASGPISAFGGWIDDIRIDARAEPTPSRFSDYVLTTRGTNSGPGYSRGNCLPAVAVPHGFNLWTPVTNSSEMHWLYHYQRDNNAENLPTIEAFRLSHLPSPWLGDRAAFQVMPFAAGNGPSRNRTRRAAPFRHEHEIARPYYYSVTFENGIKVEITPTEHAAMLRFTFPTREATLLFDHVAGEGGLMTLLPTSRALIASGLSASDHAQAAGTTTMYVRAEFDKPISEANLLSTEAAYYKFDLPEDDFTVTMKMSASFFGRDQAEHNIDLEIGDLDTFDELRERAQRLWDDKLGLIRVQGASPEQLTTLYSNLYRLFLYPNQGAENTGSNAAPNEKFVSPFHPEANTGMNNLSTGGTIFSGPLTVNHGFWDTFRTSWPLLTLLTPQQTGRLIDGFVSHYDAGGWISRWSAPGQLDLMTGTSSDVAFADAFLKGVSNFDTRGAYEAALRNATVTPTASNVGRKGLEQALFRGYTSTDVDEGFSWSMAGYLNDFAIAGMATKLAEGASGSERTQYLEEAEYFRARSLNYVKLYDTRVGFFQGRGADGAFRLPPASYSAEVWGHDYSEANGWNMAFEAQHDGQGLANLYGGRAALAEKLDRFFATPETATPANAGSYGGVIHEMLEARDVRMGQLALSNEASMHIPYMYLFAGQPAKTQAKVRDALARLWAGSEIGQGYLGDDDNGALSSWQIFSALGLYPLNVGTPVYVIGSPLFTRATVRLENNRSIVVNAPANSPENIYVQSLKVNGINHTRTYLTHEQLLNGVTLDFVMGPEPSTWGTEASALPPSLTSGEGVPVTMLDVTRAQSCTNHQGQRVDGLFDDNASTQASLTGPDAFMSCSLASASEVTYYTLSSGQDSGDPASFRLEGSNNGADWQVLDERSSQTFPWRRQTRPFKVRNPGRYTRYRVVFTGDASVTLSEIELLAK